MAEISPDLAARIEQLKSSHAENPARFFMPLASAYREAGEVARAEELLRENLKRHPGYLSAHVLLGRCLADRGAVAEARNEFQYVLSVDPQNLIALRTLGEMAAAQGDRAEGRRWFGELLAVDPLNAEARQSLAALEEPEAPSAPEAGAAPSGAAGDAGGFGMVEIDEGAHEPSAAHEGAPGDVGAWGDVRLDAEPAWPSGDERTEQPEERADSFEALDFGAVDLGAQPQAPSGPSEPAEVSEASAFDAWGSIDDGQMDVAPGAVEHLDVEGYYGEADEHHEGEPHEMVTETMAELYASQGFLDRAADVYRELISRRGEEPALVRRLDELEARMRAGAGEPASAEAYGTLPEPEPAEQYGEAPADAFGGFGAGPAEDFDLPEAQPFGGGEAASFGELPEPEPVEAGEPEPPSWLETVDAVVSGSAAPSGLPYVGLDDTLPDLDLSTDLNAPPLDRGDADQAEEEAAPATMAPSVLVPETAFEDEPPADDAHHAAAGAESTGDAFADSFAQGFGGDVGEGDADRQQWEAPTVEETEPVAALGGAPAFDEPAESFEEPAIPGPAAAFDEPPVEEPLIADVAEAAEQPAGETRTITAYLSSILSWRPSGAAAASAPPAEAPREPEPAAETPSPDQPWMAGGPTVADEDTGADEPWAASAESAEPAPSADVTEDEPWAASTEATESAGMTEEEPWAAPAAELGDGSPAVEGEEEASAGEDLPWLSPEPEAGTEPAAPPAADEPMPWEVGFDLSPEVPGTPAAGRAEPRQEPIAEPGGFSFEDFFSERPSEPAAPTPEPAPPAEAAPPPPAAAAPAPPPPAAPSTPAADEDEDLESFQAWLQSLKR